MVRPVADIVGSVLSRLAAVVIGFVLTATGVGLTVTIVMLPGESPWACSTWRSSWVVSSLATGLTPFEASGTCVSGVDG